MLAWFLQYVLAPHHPEHGANRFFLIVGTANDMAVLSHSAQRYLEDIKGAEARRELEGWHAAGDPPGLIFASPAPFLPE